MSVLLRSSRHRKLRIALIVMVVFGAFIWGGHKWLLSSAQSALNQRLTKRGLSLTYSSQSWSLRSGVTLNDAVLRRVSPGNEPLIEISKLHVDVLWREVWNTHAAATRWQADDASLTLHDDEGVVSLQHFTTDFELRADKIQLDGLGASNGAVAFALTGEILTAAASDTPTGTVFRLNLKPLRGVLDALQFKSGNGLFSIAGAVNLDLREAPATWNAKLHGTGKQVEWRGIPMQEAVVDALFSQDETKLSPRITFAQGTVTAELTRIGWQQQPLLMSGTLTDSGGRTSKFNGEHQGLNNKLTIASLSGNADLLELARNVPALAGQLPSNVKVTTFPDIVVKNFVWQADKQESTWSLASLQLRSPAALAVTIRDHPLNIDHLTGRVSYEKHRWQFDGFKGQLLGGQFALDASYDGKTLSNASVMLQALHLANFSPWLGKINAKLDDADLSLNYRGAICNDPAHSTGSGTLSLSHAPVIYIPLLDQAYQLFPKLLPRENSNGTGDIQASFSITKGIATIDPLKAHGESLTVTASGTVDLVKRQVAGHARANLRGLVGVATRPLSHVLTDMKISGPLDDIRVSPDTALSSAKTIVTTTANVATGGLKLSSNILQEGLSLPFETLGMFGKGKPKTATP